MADATAIDVERAMLACILKGCDPTEAGSDLFTDHTFRSVYAIAAKLRQRNEPITIEAVHLEASGKPALRELTLAYLDEIEQSVPTSLHYRQFIGQAVQHYLAERRRVVSLMATDPTVTLEELRCKVDELVAIERSGHSRGRIMDALSKRRYDPTSPPPRLPPTFRLCGRGIGTAGNLMVIASQAKAGKSAFVGGMIASTVGLRGDTLGVISANPQQQAVILFDTEQSTRDFYDVIERGLKRVNAAHPSWLRAYSIVTLSIADRLAALEAEVEAAAKKHKGIHSVFLDGVGDLVADPNDSEEAFAFVANLHSLAVRHDTVIVCVLHFNPGTEYAKTRGHLGSQLERKAETNLILEKGSDGVTVAYSVRSRHANLPKSEGMRFCWSDAFSMHVSCPRNQPVQKAS